MACCFILVRSFKSSGTRRGEGEGGGGGSALGLCTLSNTKYLVENFATVDPFLPNKKVYSEPCQTSKMERFAKLVNTSTEHFNKIIV